MTDAMELILAARFADAVSEDDFARAEDWARAAFQRAGFVRVPDDDGGGCHAA